MSWKPTPRDGHADKAIVGGRRYQPKGKPSEGRPAIDDRPVGRGASFAVRVEGRELKRVLQAAAQQLLAQRDARPGQKPHKPKPGKRDRRQDNAVQRVKEMMARVDIPFTEEERTLIEQFTLLDTRVAARHVRAAARRGGQMAARAAMRDVQVLAAVGIALRDPEVYRMAEQDPATVMPALRDWARAEVASRLADTGVDIPV
jgi:hypothetical protein